MLNSVAKRINYYYVFCPLPGSLSITNPRLHINMEVQALIILVVEFNQIELFPMLLAFFCFVLKIRNLNPAKVPFCEVLQKNRNLESSDL